MTAIMTVLIVCGTILMLTGMILGYFRWFYDTQAERYKRQYR